MCVFFSPRVCALHVDDGIEVRLERGAEVVEALDQRVGRAVRRQGAKRRRDVAQQQAPTLQETPRVS